MRDGVGCTARLDARSGSASAPGRIPLNEFWSDHDHGSLVRDRTSAKRNVRSISLPVHDHLIERFGVPVVITTGTSNLYS